MAMGQPALPWAWVRDYIAQLRALLRGEQVEVDGAMVQMLHARGLRAGASDRDTDRRRRQRTEGPAVAAELGDGVMTIGGGQPDFSWCAALAFGTVLDDGEDAGSARAFAAAGPGLAVVYHGMYEGDPAAVDGLPGGAEWRARIEDCSRIGTAPRGARGPSRRGDRTRSAAARRRPAAVRSRGPARAPHSASDSTLLEAAGVTEILYAPMGPDVPRELRAFAEVERLA